MNRIRYCLAIAWLVLSAGVLLPANAATPKMDFGIVVSEIDCHGSKETFSYVATWPDKVEAGSYNIKLGNQCVLEKQQCTTNSKQSCTAKCTKGKCRAEFTGCQTGRPGSLSIVATNAKGYGEGRYTPPSCK